MMEEENELTKRQDEMKKLKEILNNVPDYLSAIKQEDGNNSEADSRSIIVGNRRNFESVRRGDGALTRVEYGTTSEKLEAHFCGCGSITSVTIQCDKFTGHSKGFAFIEFSDKASVAIAASLHKSVFRGREIKVVPKKTNRPSISTASTVPRGRFPPASKYYYYRDPRPIRGSLRGNNSRFYPHRPSPYIWKKK